MSKNYQKHTLDNILEKGIGLYWHNGFSGIKVDKIINDLDISKGVFYHYFENKNDFGLQVVTNYTDMFVKIIESYLLDENIDYLNRLERYYSEYVLVKMNSMDIQVGCLVYNTTLEVNNFDQEFREKILAQYNKLLSPIVKYIEYGQKNNIIKNQMDSERLAKFIHNSFAGSLLESKLLQNPKPVSEFIDQFFVKIKIFNL